MPPPRKRDRVTRYQICIILGGGFLALSQGQPFLAALTVLLSYSIKLSRDLEERLLCHRDALPDAAKRWRSTYGSGGIRGPSFWYHFFWRGGLKAMQDSRLTWLAVKFHLSFGLLLAGVIFLMITRPHG